MPLMLRFEINVKNMGGCGGGGGEWSDCGGGRGSAGIRSSNLGKNMTKTPKPETESDLEREASASALASAYDMPSIKP